MDLYDIVFLGQALGRAKEAADDPVDAHDRVIRIVERLGLSHNQGVASLSEMDVFTTAYETGEHAV